MVRHQLGENLEAICGGDDLSTVVFNLIVWAESQGRLEELVEGGERVRDTDASAAASQLYWELSQGGSLTQALAGRK